MSLINEMLRDLDARRAGGTAPDDLLDGVRPTVPASRPPRRLSWLLILVLPALGAAATWWWLQPGGLENREAAAKADAPSTTAPNPLPPPASEAASAPARPEPSSGQTASVSSGRSPGAPAPVPAAEPSPVPEPPATPAPRPAPDRRGGRATPDKATPAPVRPAIRVERKPERVTDGSIEIAPRPLTPAERAADLRHRARTRLSRGDAAGAEALWRQAIALQPEDGRAYLGLATQLVREGRKADALGILRLGLRHGGSSKLRLLAARLLADQGRRNEALALLPDESVAKHADLLGLKAALLHAEKRFSEARRHYVRALALRPGHAPWWMGLGICLEAENDPSRALEAYRQALQEAGLDTPSREFVTARVRALENRQ